MKTVSSVRRLTESALLLAVAAVLSIIKLVDMPFGGSVTLFSMLPLLLISYRYGTSWGLLSGFVYGLIQLLLGLDNLSYATSFGAAVAIILLDYLFAFTMLGLGGIFRKVVASQGAALSLGALLTGALRYLCHVLSGCTVWYGLSVPTGESLVYSLGYNVYMLPEVILLVIGSLYLSRYLDFGESDITHAVRHRVPSRTATVLSATGSACLLAAAVWDIALLVPCLQTEESALVVSGLAKADWTLVGIVTVAGIALFTLFLALARSITKKN